jgi:Glycosyl transferase family 2
VESATSTITAQHTRSLANLTEIAIPIYNEEKVLAASIHRLREHLNMYFPYPFIITIADNGSTDRSWEIATRLATDLPDVQAVRVPIKGRGGAVRYAWSRSQATVVAYMDVDLSIDLDAFAPLVSSVMSGHSDLAIGTRYAQASYVDRSVKRAIFSRSLNYLLRHSIGARFSDAMCGFKAARREVIQDLLPHVRDNKWFFDPEMLLQAQRRGLRIHEVPVVCIDDPDSTVHVVRDARDDLIAMARVARRLVGGIPSTWLTTIWVLCTALYAVLVGTLYDNVSTMGANALAVVLAALVNTAALRVASIGVHGAAAVIRYQLMAWVDAALRLVSTTGGLVMLHALWPQVTASGELALTFTAAGLASRISYVLLEGRSPNPYAVTELARRVERRSSPARDSGAAPGGR